MSMALLFNMFNWLLYIFRVHLNGVPGVSKVSQYDSGSILPSLSNTAHIIPPFLKA